MSSTARKNLRIKRQAMRAIYPALMKAGKLFGVKYGVAVNDHLAKPKIPFYTLKATANNGEEIEFNRFQGKKVLIVNTASACGYTPQLSELKQLQDLYGENLVVIGFPSNDFREQEKGSDAEIATFCIRNYGVQFPLIKKTKVVKGEGQHPVYQWLTDSAKNGWNDKEPVWNFSKYLIDEKGVLTHFFETGISPMSKMITRLVS